ncbi:MAG: sulfite exporter TauE/SafE family protein [Planctomycetota bacterium]|jgi:uncharacterized membrane protein YfcA
MYIALIAILTIMASALGTMTGFGTSTIMVPVLLLVYPAPQTLLFVGIIHWFGNLWKLLLFRRGLQWKLVLYFGLPGIAATYLGASLMFNISPGVLSRVLGGFMIVYVVYLFLKDSFRVEQSTATSVCGGALSGFLAGIFGIGGAFRAMFLSSFNLPKAVYIATAGAIAIVVDTTRLTTYIAHGAHLELEPLLLWTMPLFIVASFVGAQVAKRIVYKIPQKRFRPVVAVFLFLVALKLLLFPA